MATNVVNAAPSVPSISPGMDLGSAIDSLPVVTETPEAAPQEEPTQQAPPELGTPEKQEAPAEDQPENAEAPAPAEPEAEIGEYDDITPDRETDGGKTLHFSRNKANALMAARDFQQRLQQAIPNSSVDDLVENFRRVTELDRLMVDHQSGDPQRIDSAMGEFINQNTPAPTLMALADVVPMRLAQSNPQAFAKLESNILTNWLNNKYSEAIKTGDQQLLAVAQNVDHRLRGSFREAADLQRRDPLADERQQFQQERARWDQQRAQERQQWVSSQVQQLDQDVSNALLAEIQKPLAAKLPSGKTVEEQIKALPNGDRLSKLIVKDLQDHVEEAIKANPAWEARFKTEQQRFKDNPSDKGTRENLVNMRRQFAAPIIAKNAKAVIEAVTGRVMSQNAAAHQKQQQVAQKTEPLGGGTPAQRATAAQKLADVKKRGGSLEEGYAILGL